jgi:hypothetical protein
MLTAQRFLKQKNSEKNRIPGKVFSLSVLLQDLPPTMMHFLLVIEKVPKIQESKSYETWAKGVPP